MELTLKQLKIIKKALTSYGAKSFTQEEKTDTINLLVKINLEISDQGFEENKLPHEKHGF